MKSPKLQTFVFLALAVVVTLSCRVSIQQPSQVRTPVEVTLPPASLPDQSDPGSSTSQPTPFSAAPESLASPTPAVGQLSLFDQQACMQEICILDGSFVLKRPIGPPGRNTLDTSSRYGTLRRRIRDVYHGIQFLNSTGTPVFAAAAGDVEVAGDDSQLGYGPRPGMFGNLVILQHSLPGIPEPVFTLYAHLSKIAVKAEGDVGLGEQVGQVGMSGSVRGSTLYFEVRYGANDYGAAVNPELWLEPILDDSGDPMGALAGKVVDEQGNYIPIRNIELENQHTAAGGKLPTLYLRTYLEADQLGLSPWGESFAAGDLPEGVYQITFWYGAKEFRRQIDIQPGKLTFVNFVIE